MVKEPTHPEPPDSKGPPPFGLAGWRKHAVLWAVWTSLGLSEATRLYYRYNIDQIYYTWQQVIYWGLAAWYLWGLLSPAIVRLARRVRFSPENWLLPLVIHVLSAALFSMVQLTLDALITHLGSIYLWDQADASFWEQTGYYVRFMLHRGILTYFMILFVAQALDYYQRYRDEELRRAATETQLISAQLEALRGQLHPHFLFNTLNAVTALIHTDAAAADRVLTQLGVLLRTTLETRHVQEIPLADELDFIDSYVEIQTARFGPRLQFERDVPDDLLGYPVPTMILQPLVENSIKYAVSNRVAGGTIRITAAKVGDFLELAVIDDGPGLSVGMAEGDTRGVGLKNTRERLRQIYGDNHSFEISGESPTGLRVRLKIPVADASVVPDPEE